MPDYYFPVKAMKQSHLKEPLTVTPETFDFIYVLFGSLTIQFSLDTSRDYRTEDLTVLYSQQTYRLVPGPNTMILRLSLDPEFLSAYFDSEHMVLCDTVLEPGHDYKTIRELLSTLYVQYQDSTDSSHLAFLSLLYRLLDILKKDYTLIAPKMEKSINPRYKTRLRQIQQYINLHYNQDITLETLADELYLTPQHLSRFFKKHFQMSFHSYVSQIRIQHALHDLSYTGDPITEIAIRHGFPSSASFNRSFQKTFGLSPREYRIKQKSYPDQVTHFLDTEDTSEQDILYIKEPLFFDNPGITADTALAMPLTAGFCKLINIGYAKNLLSHRLQIHIAEAKKYLKFTYVRLEGLISNAMITRHVSDQQYYFADVITILDFLYDQGTIPFIELGKNSYSCYYTENPDIPFHSYTNTHRFHTLLEAFLNFVSDHYDMDWLNQWIFEIWKSPTESITSYIDGFVTIRGLLDRYIPQASLGGPGHDCSESPDLFMECLEEFESRGICPSFFSVHLFFLQYTSPAAQIPAAAMAHADTFLHQQQWMTEQIQAHFDQSCPLYITEFNSSLLNRFFICYSCFQAAFLCQNVLALSHACDLVGYWVLSDVSFRQSPLSKLTLDQIGLITANGLKTPGFFAYNFFARLGSYYIDSGKNYFITRSSPESYQILAYNYAHIENFDILRTVKDPSFHDTYALFEKKPPLELTIQLTNITPGTYRVHSHLIDRRHGSLVDLLMQGFRKGNIPESLYLRKINSLSPSQVDYYNHICVPKEEFFYLEAKDELTLPIHLKAHAVCLIELRREV